MKVLFLNTGLGVGGAEKSMAFVANKMANSGHDVTLLTYRDNTVCQNLSEKVAHEHIQLESAGGNVRHLFFAVRQIRKYIKKNKFDIAVAFLSPSQFRLILACRFTKTKVVVSQRGDPYNVKKSLFSLFYKWIFERADGFVFQTGKARDFYGKKARKNGVVIPNPSPMLKRTAPAGSNSKIIVTASRLDIKQKRHDVLISAFNKFSLKYGDYKLFIFGDGDDRAQVEKLAQSNKGIVLKGKTADIVTSVQDASFFVLTSDYEGIPNALIEAMSLGLPCISTKCSPGGAEFLIEDGVSGLLAECGDVDDVAKKMEKLAADDGLRAKISKNAIYVNEKFNPESIAKQWEDFLIRIYKNK